MSTPDCTNNGWPIIDYPLSRVYVGDDTNGATFRAGDVTTVFVWLFQQINARVERIYMLNGWRAVAANVAVGGAPRSNHLSGTAGDVNGDKHPYEIHTQGTWRSGWTPVQVAEIRKILSEAGGLFAWGMDYRPGWRDPMHFDLSGSASPARVAQFARQVTPPPPPPPPPPAPERTENEVIAILRLIDTGDIAYLCGNGVVIPAATTEEVFAMQKALRLPEAWVDLDSFEWSRVHQAAGRIRAAQQEVS